MRKNKTALWNTHKRRLHLLFPVTGSTPTIVQECMNTMHFCTKVGVINLPGELTLGLIWYINLILKIFQKYCCSVKLKYLIAFYSNKKSTANGAFYYFSTENSSMACKSGTVFKAGLSPPTIYHNCFT